jgi:putative SOS response-associated peptidase YedK
MCGRFVQDDDLNDLLVRYALDGHRFPDWVPRWNIAPTQTIALIREVTPPDGPRQRLVGPARWSLVPPWERSLSLRYSTFNARAETLSTAKTFRGSLRHHRALIPAKGYYEWVKAGQKKTPYFVTGSAAPLAFAGLYSVWQGPEETEAVVTATIITTDAPADFAWVHPRIPVFVPEESWATWLDPAVEGNQDTVDTLLQTQSTITDTLRAYPVGPVTGDGPGLIAPVSD